MADEQLAEIKKQADATVAESLRFQAAWMGVDDPHSLDLRNADANAAEDAREKLQLIAEVELLRAASQELPAVARCAIDATETGLLECWSTAKLNGVDFEKWVIRKMAELVSIHCR